MNESIEARAQALLAALEADAPETRLAIAARLLALVAVESGSDSAIADAYEALDEAL